MRTQSRSYQGGGLESRPTVEIEIVGWVGNPRDYFVGALGTLQLSIDYRCVPNAPYNYYGRSALGTHRTTFLP